MSYTATVLSVRPDSSLPRVVTVIVLPSAETFRVTVCIILPSFLRVCSVVFASMRFKDVVSYAGAPLTGESFPSDVAVYSMPVGLPAASSPLATTWRPDVAAVIVIMLFFGAGPGTYFDFATLSFHVPMAGSLCADTARVDPMTNDSPPSNTTELTTEVTTELLKHFIRNLRVAGLHVRGRSRPEDSGGGGGTQESGWKRITIHSRDMSAICIFVTGGTFDKEYNELTGSLFFKDTHLPEMLRLGRCRVDVSVRTLMMIDSLEMTNADRALIVERCLQAAESRILITHGTDTMVETAAALAAVAGDRLRSDGATKSVPDKTIVLTGAMIPYAFGSSDGLFNLGSALSFVQALPAGVYIAMNGRYFTWDRVRKNRDTGVFEAT